MWCFHFGVNESSMRILQIDKKEKVVIHHELLLQQSRNGPLPNL